MVACKLRSGGTERADDEPAAVVGRRELGGPSAEVAGALEVRRIHGELARVADDLQLQRRIDARVDRLDQGGDRVLQASASSLDRSRQGEQASPFFLAAERQCLRDEAARALDLAGLPCRLGRRAEAAQA